MVATIEIFLDTTHSEQYREPSIIKALVSVNCRAQGHAKGPGCCTEPSEFKPISPATLRLDLSTKPQVPIIEPKNGTWVVKSCKLEQIPCFLDFHFQNAQIKY